jgi:hypothetical protein
MNHMQADLELALLHLKQMEKRIAEQRERIAHLKALGASTAVAEDFLATLLDSLQLVKIHVARITGPRPDGADKASMRDESIGQAIRERG